MQEPRQQQPQQPDKPPEYVGVADLVARWQYTPQGVRKLARKADFPAPAIVFNMGRDRAWSGADVLAFELTHPEVTSPTEKRRKVYGYFRAVSKGKQQEATDNGA